MKKKNKTVKKKQSRTSNYEIHDNGARPFCVEVDTKNKHIAIIEQRWVSGDKSSGHYEKGKTIMHTNYEEIWIGDNLLPDKHAVPKGTYAGNTILFRLKDGRYVFVGGTIYSFKSRNNEPIHQYYSPINNSDVPYPYAVGETYTYFLLDKKTIPNELLDLKKDGYGQFYGFSVTDKAYFKKEIEPSKKLFPVSIVRKN